MSKSTSKGGKIIKAARMARGYSRQEYASRIGYSVNTLYNWEQAGLTPGFDAVDSIVRDLSFTMSEAMELADVDNDD
jgi:transcriptional regulator with XRE-family HTH domain